MKKRFLTGALAATGLCGVALVVGDEVPTKAPEKLPTPVVDTHELMEVFYERLYEHLKADMTAEPADKKAWSHLKHHGFEAAELANLVAIRTVEDDALRAKWAGLSRDGQQAGLDLAAAATAKDWPKTQAAYQSLVKNCNACHEASGDDHAPQLEP